MRAAHLAHPDDPRRSACGLVWWRDSAVQLELARASKGKARKPCALCRRSRAVLDVERAHRLRCLAGRPLLVLDFDGVFNHAAFFTERIAARAAGAYAEVQTFTTTVTGLRFTYTHHAITAPEAPGQKPRAPRFDRACVERAGQLARQVEAAVAISSSWREGDSLDGLRRLLLAYGFPDEVPFAGSTPVLGGAARGSEIRAFLDELPEPPPSLVILDDEDIGGSVQPFHIRTDPDDGGFTAERYGAALAMFGDPPAPVPWRTRETG